MKRDFRFLGTLALMMSVCSMGLAATSETTEGRGPAFGVHAGIAFPDFQTPAEITSTPNKGYVVGVSGELPLSPLLTLRPELSLSQKKMDFVRAGLNQNAQWSTLEIPLFLKANLGTTVRPFLLAGPMAIINFSRTVTGAGGFNPRTTEWGAAVGGGIDLSSFFATLRYQIGLTDVDENSADWRSRGFQLLIGFNFG
jgi:hypothetical protein